MAGNVWEWCQSLYVPYTYSVEDGREDVEAIGYRVLRGGAFSLSGSGVRCAYRGWADPGRSYFSLGFCVVLAPDPSDL